MLRVVGFLTRRTVEAPAPEQRATYSVANPDFAYLIGATPAAGVSVTEQTALGLTSVWRAVAAIAETIAGSLPLKVFRDQGGIRTEVPSTFLAEPGTPTGLTKPEWVSLVVAHMVLHGNAFLLHIQNGAGALAGLLPLYPASVTVETDMVGIKRFKVTLENGTQVVYREAELTHIIGLSTDGVMGLAPLRLLRHALGSAIAADQTASNLFRNGLSVAGFVVVEGATAEQAQETVAGLTANASGVENAGKLRALNRAVTFVPVMHTPEDAQFLEQRVFSVEEVARAFGIPKVLLAQDGASTWGTGIAELNRWFAQTTLRSYTTRIEARLSRLLPRGTFAEFEYAGLLSASPEREIELLIAQVAGGLLTVDEARAIRNLPPLPEAPAPMPALAEPEVRSLDPYQPLNLELRQEPVTVNVPAPIVNVTVDAPAITVEAPAVTLEPTPVVIRNELVVPPPGDRNVTFQRNNKGLIVGAEIEDG